jgi:hypothetical protein
VGSRVRLGRDKKVFPHLGTTIPTTPSAYGHFPIYGLEMPRLGHARILDGWLNPQKPMFGENLRWLYRKGVAGYQYERIRTLNDINVRHN